MLVSQLAQEISARIKALGILSTINNSNLLIDEHDDKAKLKRIWITDIPKENVWVFQSERQESDYEYLSNKQHTVEKCLLFLSGKKLYIYLIELKSTLTENKIKQTKKKFICSLMEVAIYIAINAFFQKLTNVEIQPIGIIAFNEIKVNQNQQAIFRKNQLSSSLRKQAANFTFTETKNLQIATTELKTPLIEEPFKTPVLFFQNPNHIKNNNSQSESFSISFQKLIKNTRPK